MKFKEARIRFQAVRDRIQSTSSILTQICNLLEQKVREVNKDSAIFLEITQDKRKCELLLEKVEQKVRDRSTIFETYEKGGSQLDDSARHKLYQLERDIFECSEDINSLKEGFQLKLSTLYFHIEDKK